MIRSERLRLTLLSSDLIALILAGDRERTRKLLGASIPSIWPDDRDRRLLEMRSEQIRKDPSSAQWLARAIIEETANRFVGHIGFHGPPGEGGFVEVGYRILPEDRRQGYALEAVLALFSWAEDKHDVRRFRASVGPWNEPSLALVAQLGFVQTGVQWDEEDGEELVFDLERSNT